MTADHCMSLLENGHKVAISVQFIETIDKLTEALTKEGVLTTEISGRCKNADERERRRLEFQKGDADVALFTVEEAISLHQGEFPDFAPSNRPRSQIIHDLRWGAISMKQIEGRTHRDGKFSQMYWMVGAGTIEEQIAVVVAERIKNMDRMNGDRQSDCLAEIEATLKAAIGF